MRNVNATQYIGNKTFTSRRPNDCPLTEWQRAVEFMKRSLVSTMFSDGVKTQATEVVCKKKRRMVYIQQFS